MLTNKVFNFKGKLKEIEFPCIMGILNLSEDSFYSGSYVSNEKQLLCKAEKMINEGATILDVGAVSTRPGAQLSDENMELRKIIPAVKLLRNTFSDILISVDTYRAVVAENAVNEGADIINDISGGSFEENFFNVVSKLKVPYVLTHIQGKPQNMQNNPTYDDVVKEVNYYFASKIQQLNKIGIYDIIIDPGFGFGKTIKHNYLLLSNLSFFHIHNCPVLVGLSRKSMIYKILDTNPEGALYGTLFVNTIALLKGAHILRVHDVKPTMDLIKIFKYYNTQNKN